MSYPADVPTPQFVLDLRAVVAAVEHLLGVCALRLGVCPNGDQVHWLDTAFRCRLVSGEAHVGDDESVDVGWFALDQLPGIPLRHRECIEHAVSPEPAARFRLA